MKKQLKSAQNQVEAVAGQTVTVAQGALLKGADLLAGVAAPTREVVEQALATSGRAMDKAKVLVDAELETFAVVTALGAKRLKAAGEAQDLDTLIKGQVALFPEAKTALMGEAKKYLELYFAAKSKLDAAIEKNALALVTPKVKARKVAAPAKATA
jgi:hypothetical protein